MKYMAPIILIIVGLINIAPLTGVMSATTLEGMYEVDLNNGDLVILLRHRAILFGMLGAFILYAAFHRRLQQTASIAALLSMISFVALVYLQGDGGDAIQKVVRIDLFAITLTAILLAVQPWKRLAAQH